MQNQDAPVGQGKRAAAAACDGNGPVRDARTEINSGDTIGHRQQKPPAWVNCYAVDCRCERLDAVQDHLSVHARRGLGDDRNHLFQQAPQRQSRQLRLLGRHNEVHQARVDLAAIGRPVHQFSEQVGGREQARQHRLQVRPVNEAYVGCCPRSALRRASPV